MKLNEERRIPNPNRKEKQINIRIGISSEHDLEVLKKIYPGWSVGKIIRACISSAAKAAKGVL